jgi:hypothetical protein
LKEIKANTMKKLSFLILTIILWTTSFGQTLETVYLNPKDSSSNMFVAVMPENVPVKAFMFCIPGAFQTPQYVLQQTNLPMYAAKEGILTIIPVFATGVSSFGFDSLTQQSLKRMLNVVVEKYKLQRKDFFIGGLSIGGTHAVKYAELAVQNNYPIKPKAVFGIDPPLDYERLYNSSVRIMRLSVNVKPNDEIPYMIGRIQNEMQGTPKTALQNFYKLSPYSMSDTIQTAIKNLVDTPLVLIAEPDIDWWLSQRGYDYTDINAIDEAGMVNELQRLGNRKAILITTHKKGFRKPGHIRHPHSWSIADPEQLVSWLLQQS